MTTNEESTNTAMAHCFYMVSDIPSVIYDNHSIRRTFLGHVYGPLYRSGTYVSRGCNFRSRFALKATREISTYIRKKALCYSVCVPTLHCKSDVCYNNKKLKRPFLVSVLNCVPLRIELQLAVRSCCFGYSTAIFTHQNYVTQNKARI